MIPGLEFLDLFKSALDLSGDIQFYSLTTGCLRPSVDNPHLF